MHSPFNCTNLIPPDILGSEQITSILAHSNRIFLGTEIGSLLIFELAIASTSTAPPIATLSARHDGFCKKSIEQLGIIKELNALVSLSGGDVQLYSLATFKPISTFSSQTRATASLFLLSTNIHFATSASKSSIALSATPEIHTILAVACRRKLLLFCWIDGIVMKMMEVTLPHQIRGMSSVEGEKNRKIIVGFSTGEYGIISLPILRVNSNSKENIATLGDCFQLPFPQPILDSTTTSTQVSTGIGALGSYAERFGGIGNLAKATGNVMGLGTLGIKKLEKNLVIGIPSSNKGKGIELGKSNEHSAWLFEKEWGWEMEDSIIENEVIVARDYVSMPISATGKVRSTSHDPKSQQAIIYANPPDEITVSLPYIISLVPATTPLTISGQIPPRLTPTLLINSVDSLASLQTLEVPPNDLLAPSELVDDKGIASTGTFTQSTARLLTIASSTSQSPVLVLTSTPSSKSSEDSSHTHTTEQNIWIVRMESWEHQIEELGKLGMWKEAIRFLRKSSMGGSDVSPSLLRKLSILHARSLFDSKLFDLAIDAFISLNLTPAKVVSLFPIPISGKLFREPFAIEELFGGRSSSEVFRAIEEQVESDLEVGKSTVVGKVKVIEDDAASIRSVPGSVGRRIASTSSWLRDREKNEVVETLEEIAQATAVENAKQEQARVKSEAHNFTRSVDVFIRYLTDRRQKYAQALSALLPSARPIPSTHVPSATAAELLALPDLPLSQLTPQQLAQVAQVVDTALFKSYLATKPAMVGPLCRIENWCEVEEVEELLLNAEKYRELLDLYNGKNMHEQAVKLLKKMSEEVDELEEKVGPTVRYLQKLGSTHLILIFESSKWIFDLDPQAALEIFIADLEEVESLPRHATMAHLEKVSPFSCVAYLEHIIHTLGEEGSEFHEKLIDLYLATIQSPVKSVDTLNSDSDSDYNKLLDFLDNSTSYRADRVLGRLPSEDMYEIRAILLGRLGRHEGALQIYVYQLEDHATAEEYCSRVYEAIPSMRATIFHVLLRIYLRPRPNHPLLFTPALSLISNHAASIDPIEVFDLLPPLVALSDIKIFLEKTLRKSSEKVREGKVIRGIARSMMDENERQVVDLEERRVKITDSRVCPQCHKRLGNSVIAIHSPHGEVTHYQCRERFQEMKQ